MEDNGRGTKQIIENVVSNNKSGSGVPNQNNITGSMATGQNSSNVVPNMSQDNGQTSSSAIPGQPSEIFYDKNGQASYNGPDNSQDNLQTTSSEIPYQQSKLVNNPNEPLDKDEIKRVQKKEAKKKEREDAKVTGEAMATVGVAAAGYFGGPTAGKWAARAKKYSVLSKAGHNHYGRKINKRVPGAAEIARLGKNLGLYDAVDSVAGGGLASKKNGASIKAAKSVLQNSKAGAIKKDSASVGNAGGNGKLDNIKSALGNNSFSNIGKSGSAKNSKNTGIISGFFNKNSKSFFKKYKFIIIGVGAFFFIILAIFMGGVSGHSSYGSSAISSVSEGKDAGEYFKEFYEICESDTELCSDEYLSMIESQKAFFEELDKVGKSYNLSDKQKLMILETITYGYDIDDIELGKTFVIDENNEASETDNVYDEEKNTIGFLAEKFNGSDDNYYNYLIKENYFDDRPNCINDFAKYARTAGLESISSLSDSDREIVRGKIVFQIKSNVNSQYPEKNNTKIITVSSNLSFWWPIGSTVKTILNIQNKSLEFANGLPAFTGISSKFGMRIHPITGKYKLHDGIDIPATIDTPVIASQSGTVIAVTNSCATTNSNGCGGGYGNRVEITDTNGNINLYAHLAKDTITVKVGEQVLQGQVIASVGSSGNSTGSHLHFTIKTNGQAVNPLDYVDPDNPRPKSSGRLNYNYSAYSSTEFATLLKNYYSRDTVCNSSSKQHVNGCNSFKNEILNNNGANVLYEVATSYNVNPELVVIRSMIEGYSPGTYYNYFGFACYNTASIESCTKFSSFKSSMNSFFKNLSQYTSLENMAEHYASLGDYWYTQRNWGLGGCIYAEYIYPDGVPDRVKEICAYPEDFCTKYDTKNCFKTTDEDKAAFTAFQVRKMEEVAEKVFG